jgi:multiple sugar transport system substrate-binding protein
MFWHRHRITKCYLVIGLLLLMILAACAKATEEATVPGPAEIEEPVEITLWWHTHMPAIERLEGLIAQYQADHPNVTINIDHTPLKDYTEKLSVALATGTGPDVFNLLDPYVAGYYAKDLLAPYDPTVWGFDSLDALLETYLPGTLDGLIFNGELYGIPNQMNSFSLYLNKQCFDDVGLTVETDYPKTWDDLIEIGQDMVKYDDQGRMIREAFDFSYNGPTWHQFMFEILLHQLGGEVLDNNGKASFNGPEGVEALTLWRDILFEYQLGDPNLSISTGTVPNEDFTQGNMCMWQTGPWALPQIEVNEETFKNTVVVTTPQMDADKPATLLYGFAFMLNAASYPEKNAVAQDFVRFAVSDPEGWMRECVFIQPKTGWFESEAAKETAFFDVFMTDIGHGRYLVRSENFNEISQKIMDAIDRVIFDGADPKTSLDQAAEEVNEIIEE